MTTKIKRFNESNDGMINRFMGTVDVIDIKMSHSISSNSLGKYGSEFRSSTMIMVIYKEKEVDNE